MSGVSEALKKSSLFSFIDQTSVNKLVSIARRKAFRKNDVIFQDGDPASGFYIVARGMVKVYKLSFSGAEHILHMVSEGGSFAEAVVLGRLDTYPAFAEAVLDSELLFLPKLDFLRLMRSDFELTLSILSSMSEKLKSFNSLVEGLSLQDADSRLAKYLLDLSIKSRADSFILDVKKLDLAKKLGMAPETLSRVFSRFKTRRMIRLAKAHVTILNKDSLRVISSGQKY